MKAAAELPHDENTKQKAKRQNKNRYAIEHGLCKPRQQDENRMHRRKKYVGR